MQLTRRKFVAGASGLAFCGFIQHYTKRADAKSTDIVHGYGPLQKDPTNLLDLPEGFSYKVISELGDIMDDGYLVPDRADGMGCIALEGSKVALVRNHEITLKKHDPIASRMQKPLLNVGYDQSDIGEPLPGGTTTIIYDVEAEERLQEYRSLIGTLNNCAGGVTPWGSWLSCEEDVTRKGDDAQLDHGWVFEVPAEIQELTKPEPLKALGRFKHEAAAIDPKTGIVYLTEDRPNSLFYRFIPNVYGQLDKGGQLQALGLMGETNGFDTRNWGKVSFEPNSSRDVRWIDLEATDSPNDDLRVRGYAKGAAVFARGEGVNWGDGELYFCCTSGGKASLGQVMRYQPSPNEGTEAENATPGTLQLFFESDDKDVFNYGDNLTVTPNGHLIVCEDQYTDVVNNHLRGITPQGYPYEFAKLNTQTELAGVCFSPDGLTLFVNVYQPTKTLAITGPWDKSSYT